MKRRIFPQQILCLTQANLKTRYRGSGLGVLWVVLHYVGIVAVSLYVFSEVLQKQADPLAYILAGLLPWLFLSNAVLTNVTRLEAESQLLRSFPLHPFSILLSHLLELSVSLILSILLMLGFMFLFLDWRWSWEICLKLLLSTGPWLVFSFCLTVLVSQAQILYRDTKFIITTLLNLALYLTPILYSRELVPHWAQIAVSFNPFYFMIRPFQAALTASGAEWSSAFLMAFAIGIFFVFFTLLVWKGHSHKIYTRL